MATTQRPKSRRAPAKRKKKAPARSGTPLSARAGAGIARAIDGHVGDIVGLAFVALGLLAALGIYLDMAGPAGRAVDTGVGAIVGWMRLLAPPALIAGGVALLRGGPERDAEPLDPSLAGPSPANVAVGSGLVFIATCGLAHLVGESPTIDGGIDGLADAGGLIGLAVGGALERVLAAWGAALVLVVIGLAGLVVFTRTPVRVAAAGTAAGVRPVTTVVKRGLTSLFQLRDGSDDIVDVTVFDQDADGFAGEPDDETEEERPRRRIRKPVAEASEPEFPEVPTEVEQMAIDLGPGAMPSSWKLPPANLLERSGAQEIDARAVEEAGRVLERALAEHGVETRLVGKVVGPTVTRYELELAPGVKVARVTSLHKDIAYAMASPDVRILAPIPGKQAIGIEVPNARRQLVALGDILNSDEARRAKHPLEVAIGRDINGRSIMLNLAQMPHILIAGATGAGKSSCLNSLLSSILMRATPDQVRLILVDPKRVEMGQYDRLPHLLTAVVTNPKKAANALAWAVKEMERRYDLLAEVGFRDITGYNGAFDRGELKPGLAEEREFERLPFILVVIDELSDLMMVAARDVEDSICRIAQMARAVGIHLVIATQRPSVNVITGVIKANIPARLAFAVSSVTDSRVILDQAGAERLIGKGDMLVLDSGSSIPRRIQGSWVTEDEVRKIASVWKRQAPNVAYDEAVQGTEASGHGHSGGGSSGGDDDDDLLWQAMELIVRSQLGSTSMLQRKLKVGFARAGRLMDLLEQRGVVGPSEGSKARVVLMTVDELEEMLDQRE